MVAEMGCLQKKKFRLVLVGFVLLTDIASGRQDSERASINVKKVERKKISSLKSSMKKVPGYNQADIIGGNIEKKLIEGIDKTLGFLKRTVRKLPKKSGSRLEMLERILNLSLEQAAYVAGEEYDEYDLKWRSWSDKGGKGLEPKLDNTRSLSYWKKVYAYARMITKEYPKSPRADQISFNGAVALGFLDREKKAIREYSKIIKRYPKSSVSGDAYFSIGDFYFDRSQFKKAAKKYESAIKYKRSKRYGWALFKLSWCYYNLGQFEQALSGWKKTVRYSSRMGKQKGARLKDEALRDMVFAYTELKRTEDAIRFYRRNGGEKFISKLLKLLAEIYFDQGKFKASVRVWKKLLALYPYSPEAFDAQVEIIALTYEDKDFHTLWNELERLIRHYNLKSRWARKVGGRDLDLVKDTQKSIRKLLLYYPKVIHRDAQLSNDKKGYLAARQGYQLFMKHFPEGREIPEIKEYLGDLEYFQGNYRKAGRIYMEIALLGKNKAIVFDPEGKPKKNIHKRSAKNMLDAYNKNFLPELKGLLKLNPDFRKPPKNLSRSAKNFIKSCQRYMQWYPEDKKTTKNCEIFISDIYYRTQNKKEALKSLWLIAGKYAGKKEGIVAVENLIPVYLHDKKSLYLAVKKLLSMESYKGGKIGKKLTDLMKSIEIEEILSEESAIKRAKLYEARAKKAPADKDADKFWNNAAVDYLQAGYIAGAVNAFLSIIRGYSKSELYGPALLQLAQLLESQADYKRAASYYVTFAGHFGNHQNAAGALQRACTIQTALAPDEALEICINFAERYPSAGQNAIKKLIEALWHQKSFHLVSKLIQNNYLGKFKLTPGQEIMAYHKIYAAEGKDGPRAQTAAQRIISIASAGEALQGEALRYVGEVAFDSVQSRQKEFSKFFLEGGDVNQLQSSIEGVFAALLQLEQAYSQVFASRDAYWGVAAFYQLGAAYEGFAKQLQNPPFVEGIKREELIGQLRESVVQVEAKAKEYYTAGIQAVRQFKIMNIWAIKIFNGLNRIVKRNVSFDEWVVTPDFLGSEVSQKVRSAIY